MQAAEELLRLLDCLDYGPAPESDKEARAWLKKHGATFGHFIAGEWRDPLSRRHFPTIAPATGEVLAQIAHGDAHDVDAAVQAAHAAFPGWRDLGGSRRSRVLYAIARAILQHARVLAVLEAVDNGKTIRETRDIDIPLAAGHFYYYAGWAQIFEDEFPGREPFGVVAQVIPWNFPLLMLAWKIAAAIAVGNTVVLKPAEFTPLTALYFADVILPEAGVPAGVINIVTGDGETGAALVEHPVPRKVAFTGSTDVGRVIRKKTAGTGKRVTLELGGKSPFIVFADCDIDAAVEGVVDAIWLNYGQVCCAGSRVLVEESVAAEFERRLKERMLDLLGGKSLDKNMDLGAINSAAQMSKIQRLVEQGRLEGAQIWQPEGWASPEGCFAFPPTLCTNVQPTGTLAQEEIFGPVIIMMTFRRAEEAVQLANNTIYGLAASVWTRTMSTALYVANLLRAGTVWINCTNIFNAAAPFGGFQQSGYGREGGCVNILDVTVGAELREAPAEEPVHPEVAGDGDPTFAPALHQTLRFLVGGATARPDGGSVFAIRRPDGSHLVSLGRARAKDVRNAVEAARNAFPGWAARPPADARGRIVYYMGEKLSLHRDLFAASIVVQTGCTGAQAYAEVDASIQWCFTYAAYADKFEGATIPAPAPYSITTTNEAVGVIGIRAPDERPLLGLVGPIAAAISRGNTTVVLAGKHGLTAALFVETIQTSDIPPGVVNLLMSDEEEAVIKTVAQHEDVDAVWYFGSAEGSTMVEAESAFNMKRTFVSNGRRLDWMHGSALRTWLLHEATNVKTVIATYGV